MDLAPKNLRVDGIIDYYKARLVVEGYKQKERCEFSWYMINQRGLWFLYKETKCVCLLNLCINWSKFQCTDMSYLTMRWCQMSLGLLWLVCYVKYITRDYVNVRHARVIAIIKAIEMMLTIKFNFKDVGVVDVILEIKFSNTSDGLVLSQSHERCNDSLLRTPCVKSICVFGKSL